MAPLMIDLCLQYIKRSFDSIIRKMSCPIQINKAMDTPPKKIHNVHANPWKSSSLPIKKMKIRLNILFYIHYDYSDNNANKRKNRNWYWLFFSQHMLYHVLPSRGLYWVKEASNKRLHIIYLYTLSIKKVTH